MRDSTDDAAGLLKFFVERRAFYELAVARRLAHLSAARLRQEIDEGAVEPVSDGVSLLIAWEDVASLALKRWPLRQIAQIVRRAGQVGVLPSLNRFHTIKVELPVYQIRLLHYLAEQRSPRGAPPLAISDVLEYELGALAFEEDVAAIDRVIPGFAAAANYPSLQDRPPRLAIGCVFCGGRLDTDRADCPACVARHVPPSEQFD